MHLPVMDIFQAHQIVCGSLDGARDKNWLARTFYASTLTVPSHTEIDMLGAHTLYAVR